MCLPGLNNKVTNDNHIQKRAFSFTFWFTKCLTKEMVELALLSKAWHSQRKYSTILNMVSSEHYQSETSWLSIDEN